MEWVAGVCFSSLCAASCDSVKSFARPLGVPESLVSGASDAGLVVDDSVALPLDRDLLCQPQVQ